MGSFQRAMRVLFLTCHLPFPPTSGGRLREHELLHRLDGCHVELVVVSKTYEDDVANAHRMLGACTRVDVFPAEPGDASPLVPEQVRRHRSPRASAYVAERLGRGDLDVVHLEGFYMAQHVPGQDRTPRLLVEQNVEFALWRQRALIASPVERSALLHESDRTRRAEIRAWSRSDVLAAVTDEDRRVMESTMPTKPVRLVPDGVDHLSGRRSRPGLVVVPDAPHVVYVGNFGYTPNVDAARFLCHEVMPRVVTRVPDARLLLVGASPPLAVSELEDCHPSVTVVGPVPDVTPFLDGADAVVCPLRIGGGIKVKMLEALSLGKAIVATSVAAQGIPDAHQACAIADDAATFADAVVMMLTDADLRRAYEARAERAAAAMPTWDAAAADLMACYADLAQRTSPHNLVEDSAGT